MIEVTTLGVSELIADVKALPVKLEKKVILAMSQIAYNSVQKGAGRHFKTGALFQSTFNRAVPGGRSVGHDGNRAPHAEFVIFGTQPHVIKPKNKKALRWVGPGGFVFAGKVNHPGYRGDDYMSKAKNDAVGAFNSIIQATLKESL